MLKDIVNIVRCSVNSKLIIAKFVLQRLGTVCLTSHMWVFPFLLYMHAASNQKLEVGMSWGRGYVLALALFPGLPTIQLMTASSKPKQR